MRFSAIVLCVAATGLAGVSVQSAMAQSNGPAADKVDSTSVDTGKTADQPAPPPTPETAPPPAATAPAVAPPAVASPVVAPPTVAPPVVAPPAVAPPAVTPPVVAPPAVVSPAPSPPPQPEAPPEAAAKPVDATPPHETVETVGPGQAISILGKKVVAPDGKAVLGSVIDMLVDADGKPRAAVIDFGGFLGVGSRHVAIDWNSLKFHVGDQGASVQLDIDPEAIKAAPEYKEVNAQAEVVEPPLLSPDPLPAVEPLSELPIQPVGPFEPHAGTHPGKNAGQ